MTEPADHPFATELLAAVDARDLALYNFRNTMAMPASQRAEDAPERAADAYVVAEQDLQQIIATGRSLSLYGPREGDVRTAALAPATAEAPDPGAAPAK